MAKRTQIPVKTKTLFVLRISSVAELEEHTVLKGLSRGTLIQWWPTSDEGLPGLGLPQTLSTSTPLPEARLEVPKPSQTPSPPPMFSESAVATGGEQREVQAQEPAYSSQTVLQQSSVPPKKKWWQFFKPKQEERFKRLKLTGMPCSVCGLPKSEWGDQREGKTVCNDCKKKVESALPQVR